MSKHKTPIRLEDYSTYGSYTFCYMLIVLKSYFNKTKFNCFNFFFHFFILTAYKNIKIPNASFEVGFSYKDCIQTVCTS